MLQMGSPEVTEMWLWWWQYCISESNQQYAVIIILFHTTKSDIASFLHIVLRRRNLDSHTWTCSSFLRKRHVCFIFWEGFGGVVSCSPGAPAGSRRRSDRMECHATACKQIPGREHSASVPPFFLLTEVQERVVSVFQPWECNGWWERGWGAKVWLWHAALLDTWARLGSLPV